MGESKTSKRKLEEIDLRQMCLPEEYWQAKVHHVNEGVRPRVDRLLSRLPEAVSRGVSLLVCGDIGVGKTTIASLIMKEARSRRFTALFATIWDLREMIRAKVDYDDETSMMQRAQSVDVLVLDDFRMSDTKERFLNAQDIERLIRHRSSHRKLTVVTTRMAFTDLDSNPDIAMTEYMLFLLVQGPNLYEQEVRDMEARFLGE